MGGFGSGCCSVVFGSSGIGVGFRCELEEDLGRVAAGVVFLSAVGVAAGVFSVGSGGLRQWVWFPAVAMESPRQRHACWWRGQQLRSCSSLGSSSGESCSCSRGVLG